METTDGRKDSGKRRGKKERTSTDGRWSKQVLVRLGFWGTKVWLSGDQRATEQGHQCVDQKTADK